MRTSKNFGPCSRLLFSPLGTLFKTTDGNSEFHILIKGTVCFSNFNPKAFNQVESERTLDSRARDDAVSRIKSLQDSNRQLQSQLRELESSLVSAELKANRAEKQVGDSAIISTKRY